MAVAATFDRAFLAADEGFVRFNDPTRAAQGREIARAHCFTNTMREEPSRLVLNLKDAMQLMRAYALFRRAEQMNRLQHLIQRDMRRFENSAYFHRELLAAITALPQAKARLAQVIVLAAHRTTMRANRTFRPQHAF